MALTITVQATHWQYKRTSTSLGVILGAKQEPGSRKIQDERKWLRFSDDPSDNRTKHWNHDPVSKHASTVENLWFGSSYCPEWVQPRLTCLKYANPALDRGIRAQYTESEGPSFESGRSSYLETKLTEKDDKKSNEKEKTSLSILLAALKASSSSRDLESGKKIHGDATESGDDSNVYVVNTLVDMYAKCGSMGDARGLFDRMPCHDVVSWTAIILGYAENGEGELALHLFAHMQFEGCAPNRVSFLAALKACTSLAAKEEGNEVDGKLVKMGSLEKGMTIHSQAAKSGCDSDIFVASTLVDMYAKCGSMVDARGIFDKMPCHTVVSWTAIILGYAENGEGELALQLFARMEGCAPNRVTFLAALKACTTLAATEKRKQVDEDLVKMGSLEKGMAIHSQVAKSSCYSDTVVTNTLVDMYAKCGSMVDARGIFDGMPRHNLVSWNALMLGYAENGEGELALQLFARMLPEGCAPDARSFVAALKACGSVGALEIGKRIHADIHRYGLEGNAVVTNCLVDFYGKCGSMVDAQQVFDSLATRDLVTWTALIAGYSRQGDTKCVFDLFERMQKERVQANGITFLSILTACSHAGLVDKGTEYFQTMCPKYGINPSLDHYHCMVDILGRANQLDDAVAMVKSMPFKPNAVTWMTVLGACQKWKNVVVGRLAFESFLRLDEKAPAAYVLMANIYGSVGMWEEKSKVEAMHGLGRCHHKVGGPDAHT